MYQYAAWYIWYKRRARVAHSIECVPPGGPSEISDIRGVSLETIKAQVRSLLAKTGARNRTEPVSRLLSVTLPIE